MTPLDRIAIASRAFCIAASLALAAVTREPVAAQYAVLLGVMGFTAWWLSYSSVIHHAWGAAAEGLLSGIIVGLALGAQPQIVLYLFAPTLIAGLAGGVFPLLTAILGQAVGATVLTSSSLQQDAIWARTEYVAPWLVMSFGAGLLGAWLREIGLGPTSPATDRSYESARRLVGQLRTVARRLSSGLDPVTIASRFISIAVDEFGAHDVAVFVRTDGGVLTPLVYHGPQARERLHPGDQLVQDCWDEAEAIRHGLGSESARLRVAIPIRVGARMLGVVLADCGRDCGWPPSEAAMQDIDELALRLETALAFDEVRSLATAEERNRLAREIHDGIAQEVASLGYLLDDALSEPSEAERQARLRELRYELTRVVSELRLSIFDLRLGIETATSLGMALSDYVQQVGARSSMTVHLTLDEAAVRLRSEVEAELLRIAQEAVTNARKHASATNLWVDCRIHPPAASITVRDDGSGLGRGRDDSYGLKIMRERAARIGATLTVCSSVEQGPGTSVSVVIGHAENSERRGDVPDVNSAPR